METGSIFNSPLTVVVIGWGGTQKAGGLLESSEGFACSSTCCLEAQTAGP
jgi:hypothetical protein